MAVRELILLDFFLGKNTFEKCSRDSVSGDMKPFCQGHTGSNENPISLLHNLPLVNMIKSANQYSIGGLFLTNNNAYYVIPKYQREYTWGQSHWEALYNDLLENDKGYFLGSIICISESKDALSVVPLEVVDGQQRLTTICLFLAALYTKMKEYKSEMDELQQSDMIDIMKCLKLKGAEKDIILRPQDQNHNCEDFYYVLKESGLLPNATKVNYFGQRIINRCYTYFLKQIEEDINESGNALETLFAIREKIIDSVLVKIEVDTHADAYVMFESLNNRGASLTAVDLMKNAALARAEHFGINVDDCFDNWQQILGYISNDYATQERFFRFNYNAFRKELNEPFKDSDSTKTYPLGDLATKSNLLHIYVKLIDKDLPGFLENIKTNAEIYQQFLVSEDANKKYRKEFSNLNHIQGITGYVLLLYLLRNQESLEITDDSIKSITNFLSSFFVRRNITDTPPTRDLNRMFMEIVSNISDKGLKGDVIEKEVRTFLVGRSASDEDFKDKLSGDIYLENTGVARYVLCAIAERAMTQEIYTDLWKQNLSGGKLLYVWTIEHIFPEGENIPDSWVDMIAEGNREKASEYRVKYCHKLGNLTITGYNSALGNMDYLKKRDRKKDDKYVGYRNGLSLNTELVNKDKWTVEDIKTRTNTLVNTILDMFKL